MLHRYTPSWSRTAYTAPLLLTWCLGFGLLPATSHGQIYRCGNSYSQAPCSQQEGIARTFNEAPHTGTAAISTDAKPRQYSSRKNHHPGQHAARDWDRTERELDKAEAKPQAQRSSAKDQAACDAASRRIQKIDELARRGGSAQKMERLREERQSARDRQFNAGC